MRKLRPNDHNEPRPARSPKRRAVLAILVGLTLGPLIFEGSALCVCWWRSMYGQVITAETPVLDVMDRGVQTVSRAMRLSTSRVFQNVPWKPSLVIPLACAWALGGCLLLRRR